jgi:hypothetical protein
MNWTTKEDTILSKQSFAIGLPVQNLNDYSNSGPVNERQKIVYSNYPEFEWLDHSIKSAVIKWFQNSNVLIFDPHCTQLFVTRPKNGLDIFNWF